MIERLVAMLEQKVKDLTAEEIADILWLTLQQWQLELAKVDTTQSVERSLEHSDVETLLAENTQPIPPPSGSSASTNDVQGFKAGITARPPQQASEEQNSNLGEDPLAIPDSPSLRRSLDLLKAIRPLIRLVPSAEATYLDVPATVKAIAETDLWLLKLRPVLEPWLELALVVDATPSMVIWQRTILNLHRVLAQSGVFRDVRLWSLETLDFIENIPESSEHKKSPKLCVRSGFGTTTASQPPCRPQELLDPNGRRLILVVSDCIDPRWDAQPIRDLLQILANHGPIGLVQVLPEWLWSRTALSQVSKGQMMGTRPGQASQSLTFVRRHRSLHTTPVGVKVPVMTLEPAVTNRWSQMVACKSSISSPGLIFSPVSVQKLSSDAAFDPQDIEEPTPQERLAQFRDYSSPMARQLAGILAACPEINLPVVRMVQAALLPDSQQVHVAEVLLGGLFKSQTEITAYTPADRVQYIFHDGVKPLVQETISPKQAFKALSVWIKRRFGYALEDFPAYLTEVQSEEHSKEIKPFAGLMLDVLSRQSSQYADLIARVKELAGTETVVEPQSSNSAFNWSSFSEELERSFQPLPSTSKEVKNFGIRIHKQSIALISVAADPAVDDVETGEARGQNVYVRHVGEALAKLGWQVDMFTRKANAESATIVEHAPNCRTIRLVAGPEEFVPRDNIFPYAAEFVQQILKFQKDSGIKYALVHTNYWISAWVGMELKKIQGSKQVHTYHSLGYVEYKSVPTIPLIAKKRLDVEKAVLETAESIIATNPQEKVHMRSLVSSKGNIDIIPYGTDIHRFGSVTRAQARQKLGIDLELAIILYVGRFDPRKGIETLVRAVGQSRLRGKKDLKLIIGGGSRPGESDGTERDRIEGIVAELGMSDFTIFPSRLSDETLPFCYAIADVCVVPSHYELVALEAMASGTPVVASEVGELQFIVVPEETGLLVPPKDVMVLAGAIDRILINPGWRDKLGEASKRRVQGLFSWNSVVNQLSELYEQLLQPPIVR